MGVEVDGVGEVLVVGIDLPAGLDVGHLSNGQVNMKLLH